MALISSPDGGGSVHSLPQSVFPFFDGVHTVSLQGKFSFLGHRKNTALPLVRVVYDVSLCGCPVYPKDSSQGELEEHRQMRHFQGFLPVGDFLYGLNSRALVDFVSAEERARLRARPPHKTSEVCRSEKTLTKFLQDRSGDLAGVTYAFVDGEYKQSFWWTDPTIHSDDSQMRDRFVRYFVDFNRTSGASQIQNELMNPFVDIDIKRYGVPCTLIAFEGSDIVRTRSESSLVDLLMFVTEKSSEVERRILHFAVADMYKKQM